MEGPDEDVARLNVPVNDVERMQVADTIGNLENRQNLKQYTLQNITSMYASGMILASNTLDFLI